MKPTLSFILTAFRRIAIFILVILSLYFGMAFLGAVIPANPSWQQPSQASNDDIDIYVETNGIHVSIILPLGGDKGILSNKLRASHMQNPQYHTQYAMIGWGHKGVYQNAEDWNDLTLSDATSAVIGTGDSLMHIYYRNAPKPNEYRKKIRISRDQYFHILRNISGYFQYDSNGKLRTYAGYGDNNIFYAAHGSYSALNSCNVWVGRILREAGVKIGFWTPFSQSIMHRF